MSHPGRHSRVVRQTHWLNALAFAGLLYSGLAISIAHPRFYWGQSGFEGMPALFSLPVTKHTAYSVWARNLHFLSAWVCLITGSVYLLAGFVSRHFTRDLLPKPSEWRPLALAAAVNADARAYSLSQKLAYLGVVFVLFPAVIVTGLAMAPGIVAAFPVLDCFGGHQSARTLHFIVSALLVLFVIAHVTMVYRSGFRKNLRAMTFGTDE